MWKFWVGAIAFGVAVFGAVVVVGLRAVDSEAEPAPPLPLPKPQTWAEQASAHCTNSLDTVRAKLTGAAGTGTATAAASRKTAVRLFVETTDIEGRLVSDLRAIPKGTNQAKVDEAVGYLAEQHAKDVQVGRQLQQHYDEQLLRKAVQEYEQVATRLRRLFRALGATGCVSYFNPASYE